MPHSPVSEEKLVGFPARCLSLRQKLRVSKPELAHWLGVGRSYVTVLEKGRQAPSRPVFQLIEKLEAAANLKQLAMHMPQPDTPCVKKWASLVQNSPSASASHAST
ncbi:MAG: helix-turn-helix transcriptional regulator [Verrucomicrobia bacterium]|nr:helix-turn-helix transcriptional regulator [Verrucomicrobiota bacterium]